MANVKRLSILALVVSILIPFLLPGVTVAQRDDLVAQIMADMSSAEKVGQLFLVTFPGSEIDDESIITELIRDYHVGGVLLLPENDNVINEIATSNNQAMLHAPER